MSMMGELKFLELQMKQTGNGIHQTKYFNEHLKKFNLEEYFNDVFLIKKHNN